MTPSQRQRRQATACDWCRSHKVKCDAEQPSCRNCVRQDIQCVTVNLRKPSLEGKRQPPTGRRRRDTTRSSVSFSIAEGSRSETAVAPTNELHTTRYPPSPLQPARRTFEAQSPSRILPEVFATPFDEDMRDQRKESPGTGDPGSRPDSSPSHGLMESHCISNIATHSTDKSSCLRRQAVGGGGSSQYVLVQWLDLFFSQCPTWTPVFPLMQQGLAYSMEVPLPFSVALPQLPFVGKARAYADIFFARIHPVFPVIEQDAFHRSLDGLRKKVDSEGGGPDALEPHDYPLLATAYAVFSASADEAEGGVSVDGTRYLQGAYVLYGHLVATPYVTSVQALLLLALVLYNRCKDGASWGTLGQAVRIAQSLSLHRHVAPDSSLVPPVSSQSDGGGNGFDENLRSRIWWAAYTLERTMELESGRPSAIRDDECDQIIPSRPAACPLDFDYFGALVWLAQIQARAISLLYGNKNERKSVQALLCEMGRIDRALLDWADSFPESIRPGRDLFCGADELHLATYVSLRYHQTLVTLHRPALVSAPGFLRNRIDKYCTGTPWRDRLHFSLCIGVASARAMLKAVNDLLMYAGPSRLVASNQILLAVLVLGIYITKVPMSRMNSSDLAMLVTFAENIEDEYVRMGQDAGFARGLKTLRQQLIDIMGGGPKPDSATATETYSAVQPQGVETDAMLPGVDFGTDLANLEDSWSHLWNEDFGTLTSGSGEQDTTNMYLLGIPQSWA